MFPSFRTDLAMPSVLELCAGRSAATVYEAIGKRGEVGPSLYPINPGKLLLGCAYTVRCFVGDAKPIWWAIAEAPAGSVIAIDCGGTSMATAIGGTSVLAASRRGIAGLITNGAVRDIAEIRASTMPVYATGVSVRGTSKSSDGWQQIPICLGQAVINPGDLVVGDEDGLVIVDQKLFLDLPSMLARQVSRETEIDPVLGSKHT